MGEKIVRWVVPIIPTLLLVSCVVAAFATNGWDVKATLFAEDPAKIAESLTDFGPAAGSEIFEFGEPNIYRDRITVETGINSPLNIPVMVEELSADIGIGDSTSTISLQEPVTIPAKGSANLTVEGTLSDIQAISDLQALMSSGNFEIRGVTMKIDVAGIKLEIKESGGTTGGNI